MTSVVIDCHMHVRGGADGSLDAQYCEDTIEAGKRLGIGLFCVSDLSLTGDVRYDRFHQANDRVLQALQRYPGWYRGYCFVNPGDPKALDELDRRVRGDGFIGVKLYNQYRIDDPVMDPLIERCIEWQIPILMHAGHPMDDETRNRQPNISDASHFARAAQRYPEAILIEGHIGGGGDWEWALKHLRECPSVYLDTSGSVVDESIVDRCVTAIGAERLLFATDMTMEGGVGKVLDADLTPEQRDRIMGGNFQAILDRRRVQ